MLPICCEYYPTQSGSVSHLISSSFHFGSASRPQWRKSNRTNLSAPVSYFILYRPVLLYSMHIRCEYRPVVRTGFWPAAEMYGAIHGLSSAERSHSSSFGSGAAWTQVCSYTLAETVPNRPFFSFYGLTLRTPASSVPHLRGSFVVFPHQGNALAFKLLPSGGGAAPKSPTRTVVI
jgi:hypothetical protein